MCFAAWSTGNVECVGQTGVRWSTKRQSNRVTDLALDVMPASNSISNLKSPSRSWSWVMRSLRLIYDTSNLGDDSTFSGTWKTNLWHLQITSQTCHVHCTAGTC